MYWLIGYLGFRQENHIGLFSLQKYNSDLMSLLALHVP